MEEPGAGDLKPDPDFQATQQQTSQKLNMADFVSYTTDTTPLQMQSIQEIDIPNLSHETTDTTIPLSDTPTARPHQPEQGTQSVEAGMGIQGPTMEYDVDDLFGDADEEISPPTELQGTEANRSMDPNNDGGLAYESDGEDWDVSIDQEEATQVSLATLNDQLRREQRMERRRTEVRRGALDVDSDDDSSSSEGSDEESDEESGSDEELKTGIEEQVEMESSFGEPVETPDESGTGPEHVGDNDVVEGSTMEIESIRENSRKSPDFHGEEGGDDDELFIPPSPIGSSTSALFGNPGQDEDEVNGSPHEDCENGGTEGRREASAAHDAAATPASGHDKLMEDERPYAEIFNDLVAETLQKQKSSTPVGKPPVRQQRKRRLADTGSSHPIEVSDDQAATKRLGFVPTRSRRVFRGPRGTPRHPELEDGSDQETTNRRSQGPEMAPPALPVPHPMPSFTLPMPTISLPMPSVNLPMPSVGALQPRSTLPQPNMASSPLQLNLEDAQDSMFAFMTGAKRSGMPAFDAPPLTATSHSRETTTSSMRTAPLYPVIEAERVSDEIHGDSDGSDAEVDLKRQIERFKRKRGRRELTSAGEIQLARMQQELRVLKRRREKASSHDAEETIPGQRDAEDEGDERRKRRKEAQERAEQDLELAIQQEEAQPTQFVTSSRQRRPRNAREYRHQNPEKQADREEREFFRGPRKPKGQTTTDAQDSGAAKKNLFKNRLASRQDTSTDEIMAKVLTFINPNADAIQQRREQGDVEPEPEIQASTKKQQFADLLLSIPTDGDVRTARSQRAALSRASKAFGFGRVKAENGKWLLRGMHSALYHHQLEAADWMVSRELSGKQPKGGILGDAMGLGKTVTTLATMVGNPPDNRQLKSKQKATLIILPRTLVSQWSEEIARHVKPEAISKVLVYKKNMKLQLAVVQDVDVVLTTYQEVLASWNIKMSERDIQAADMLGIDKWREMHRDELGLLHQVNWYRIVLDEAHQIKNWKSQSAQACFHLNAEYRWTLTGTPMMNSLDELYPYFKFFRLQFSDNFKAFKRAFSDSSAIDASKRLSVIMRMVMKRRTFGDTMLGRPLIPLPLPQAELRVVKFSKEEVVIYRMIEDKFRHEINNQLREQNLPTQNTYAHLLSHLLRLRQAAAHPFLLEGLIKEIFDATELQFLKEKLMRLGRTKIPMYDQIEQWIKPKGSEDTALPFGKSNFGFRFQMEIFLDTVNEADAVRRTRCAFCRDLVDKPQVADCGHVFCKDCIEGQTARNSASSAEYYACPDCNALVTQWEPFRRPDKEASAGGSRPAPNARKNKRDDKWKPPVKSEWLDMCDKNPKLLPPSAKLIAVKSLVIKWLNDAPEDKILIFTQFKAMARLVGLMCDVEKISRVYFMGDMSEAQREYSVERFRNDKEVKVMIASLKCGGVGLNLNCANRCISIDPWWNHSVEQQAFGRVFRLGQNKVTHFVRLFAKNTVDYRILDLQKDKIAAIDEAMQTGKMNNLPPLSLEEIAGLFGQLVEEEDGVLQVTRDYGDGDVDVEVGDEAQQSDGSVSGVQDGGDQEAGGQQAEGQVSGGQEDTEMEDDARAGGEVDNTDPSV